MNSVDSIRFLNRICDALGLPKRTRRVTIDADVKSLVIVRVEVVPDKEQMRELAAIIEEYELRKISKGENDG